MGWRSVECPTETRDGVVVVAPRGDLDLATTGEFKAHVDALLADGAHDFVVDMTGIRFMDSSGLGALVHLFKRVRMGEGDVRVAAVPPLVMQVFELTRLDRVFDIFPDVDAAVSAFQTS